MLNVLMVGPARNVKGGMTTVVDNYFKYGLKEKFNLKYIESCNDSNIISKLIQELKGLYKFKKSIKNFDIVHIHMASRRSTFRKIKYVNIAKKYEKKVIIHIHGGGFKKFYDNECNERQRKYIKINLNKADRVIVLSDEWRKYFSKFIEKEKIEIINNGVKVPEYYDKDLFNKNILFLGRISRQKGIYDLIYSLKQIQKKYSNVCLYIGGLGENEKVEKLLFELGLEKNVKMLGWIDNKRKKEIFKKCSIFVLPSYFEAMPMSILEAMSYNCVTISTNVGSIPKIIENNKNGIIIKPGDINGISNVILSLYENKSMMRKISSNARITIEKKYDIKQSIRKVEKLYEKIIQ